MLGIEHGLRVVLSWSPLNTVQGEIVSGAPNSPSSSYHRHMARKACRVLTSRGCASDSPKEFNPLLHLRLRAGHEDIGVLSCATLVP